MAHTKGNWQRVWNTNNSPETCIIKAVSKDGSKQSICKIVTNEDDSDNAKLISNAPELLEALRQIALKQDIVGVTGCTWSDTHYDSNSVAYGYNQCLEHLQGIAAKAVLNATV